MRMVMMLASSRYHRQRFGGQNLVQRLKQVFQVQVEQADEVVDAHQQGEEGQDQEVRQGRRRPGGPDGHVALRRLHHEGDRGK